MCGGGEYPTHTWVQVLKKATKGYRVPGGWSYRFSVMAVCALNCWVLSSAPYMLLFVTTHTFFFSNKLTTDTHWFCVSISKFSLWFARALFEWSLSLFMKAPSHKGMAFQICIGVLSTSLPEGTPSKSSTSCTQLTSGFHFTVTKQSM